jgi:hypothetical protein
MQSITGGQAAALNYFQTAGVGGLSDGDAAVLVNIIRTTAMNYALCYNEIEAFLRARIGDSVSPSLINDLIRQVDAGLA